MIEDAAMYLGRHPRNVDLILHDAVVCDEITVWFGQLDDNGQIMDDRIGIRMGSTKPESWRGAWRT
jgi:hypothetical protein